VVKPRLACIEGVVATAAGIATGSVALLGYGLDSAIQSLGSGVIIWRFTGRRITSVDAERRAQRVVAAASSCSRPTSRERL
jgi:hypothetical protein